MEVYEDVEKDNKALKQDESLEFIRRKAIYVVGSFQFAHDDSQKVHA